MLNNNVNNFSDEATEENNEVVIYTYPTSKKNSRFSKKTVITVAACMWLSFCSAFAGAALGSNSFESKASNVSTGTVSQSIIKTTNQSSPSVGLSISDIAELTSDSVVEISTETAVTSTRMRQFISKGAGSGVIISSDGYIVTNNHVIDGATKIHVRLSDGKTYEATLKGKDAQTDLAVIKIDGGNLTPAVIGTSSALKVGELAVAIGNPLGELGGTVTNGIISALDREITIDGETMTLLQTNAAINPGNSGGGLFNSKGELIGIVNAKSSGSDIEGIGFAIPIDIARKVISELTEKGYVSGRPGLGVSLIDITNTTTAIMYRVSKLGVYVAEAEQNSSLKAGDLILSINNYPIQSSADVKSALKNQKIGDEISVKVLRGNVQETLTVKLIELKSS